jgi:hypothetical protein
MFPTAQNPQGTPLLTEEELTRQQMLMLLLKAEHESAQNGTSPPGTSSEQASNRENGTFRIDLNLPDDDELQNNLSSNVPYPQQATELAARRYTQQLQLQQQHLQHQIAVQRMAGGNSISSLQHAGSLQPPTGLGFLERMTGAGSSATHARTASGNYVPLRPAPSAWDVRARRSEERSRGLGAPGPGNMGGPSRAKSKEEREARRREIELGTR